MDEEGTFLPNMLIASVKYNHYTQGNPYIFIGNFWPARMYGFLISFFRNPQEPAHQKTEEEPNDRQRFQCCWCWDVRSGKTRTE